MNDSIVDTDTVDEVWISFGRFDVWCFPVVTDLPVFIQRFHIQAYESFIYI